MRRSFLLWGFNGEAFLCSSSSDYLLSALFSLLGLRLILAGTERICGDGGVPSARCSRLSRSWTLQTAGTVGILVWSIWLALRLIDSGRLQKACLWEGLWLALAGGFGVGGLLTTWLANLNHSPRAGDGAFDFFEKLNYWLTLNHTFLFWPGFYPLALKIPPRRATRARLGAIPAWFLWKAGRSSPHAGLILLVFVTGFILPYFCEPHRRVRLDVFPRLLFRAAVPHRDSRRAFQRGLRSCWITGALAAVVAMIGSFQHRRSPRPMPATTSGSTRQTRRSSSQIGENGRHHPMQFGHDPFGNGFRESFRHALTLLVRRSIPATFNSITAAVTASSFCPPSGW